MSSFLKVDIRLVIDDGRNSNQKTFFNLREIDDDLESLYQTRAKDWFPFSLTMKVPGLNPHQTVQVCFDDCCKLRTYGFTGQSKEAQILPWATKTPSQKM